MQHVHGQPARHGGACDTAAKGIVFGATMARRATRATLRHDQCGLPAKGTANAGPDIDLTPPAAIFKRRLHCIDSILPRDAGGDRICWDHFG